jgi:hypothetical protein
MTVTVVQASPAKRSFAGVSRRTSIALLAALIGLNPAPAAGGLFRVTLLGSGTPAPSPERFGYSTLVEAGDQKLIFDFGRGVTIRLAQLNGLNGNAREEDLIALTRAVYDAPLQVGRNLMAITIGDSPAVSSVPDTGKDKK